MAQRRATALLASAALGLPTGICLAETATSNASSHTAEVQVVHVFATVRDQKGGSEPTWTSRPSFWKKRRGARDRLLFFARGRSAAAPRSARRPKHGPSAADSRRARSRPVIPPGHDPAEPGLGVPISLHPEVEWLQGFTGSDESFPQNGPRPASIPALPQRGAMPAAGASPEARSYWARFFLTGGMFRADPGARRWSSFRTAAPKAA